jgi:Fur family transcriptional regulator, ferric uptake regulator
MIGLQEPLQKLRDAGYKITNARLAVLTVLHESDGHLTSAEVLARVDALDPSIGRASVFRALELLTGLSIIRPTYIQTRTPAFVLLSQEGHHAHIICTNCSQIIELAECYADDLIGELETRHGMRLTGHLLEFYGKCEACAQAGAAYPLEPR